MRILLLGTGSADGWPNPFCACDSCEAERTAGRSRKPSSVLVDDVILLDCGPTAPHAAGSAGRSLRGVEHVLVTHGHPDHLDPAFLLSRAWIESPHPLHVWAPPLALDLCRHWLGPDAPVVLHAVAPGDVLDLDTAAGRYRITAIAAAHDSGNGDELSREAVLFQVEAPDGDRMLYATDTAALPATTVASICGPLAALLVDETFGDTLDHGTGHLDLGTLPAFLDTLRDHGAVTSSTTVVATHLSHHNPPTPILRARLRDLGVLVLDDLAEIDTSRPGGRTPTRRLVLGGARSGKSVHAERLVADAHHVVYVATGGVRADDAEWRERVAVHRARRPEHWTTVETIDVAGVLDGAASTDMVIVDCLSLWLAGQLDDADAWSRLETADAAAVRSDVDARLDRLVTSVAAAACDVVLVSNEVGMGVVPATASGRLFRDLLGIVNARVSAACDETTLMVAGRALRLDDPTTASPDRRT
jgi:adenosylcobinamide kinase / adenosylcobinamide-phosphate guanylyltransferase